jgi:hypothetical protein
MDVAGVIWLTVFGVVIGAAVLYCGIFIYRFIRAYRNATASKYLWLVASASRTSGATQTALHR